MKTNNLYFGRCIGTSHTFVKYTGCKKDKALKNADKNTNGTYSFSNTEYTGLANVGNHYFPRPLSLRLSEEMM